MKFGPKGRELAKKLKKPFQYRIYVWKHLPSMFFWKTKIIAIDEGNCKVTLPYIKRTKNPFQSTYFAAMMGAGEMSTGLLCMLHLADRGKWSMLVTHVSAEFYKKTNTLLTFHCSQGIELLNKLNQIESLGKPDTFTMESSGTNPAGDVAVKVFITWSFKKKA